MITYATKVWRKEFKDVLERHPKADLVVGNNLGLEFIDIGDTDEPYYAPELVAVNAAEGEHILWYAGDVIPPHEDWVAVALPLLKQYPIVTCNPWADNVRVDFTYALEKTDFGWLTQHFSDQCYLATTEFMRSIDYDTEHPIAKDYPKHGGNSFERRVAQYMANKNLWVAILRDYHCAHIDRSQK